jgi:hypothetical protein
MYLSIQCVLFERKKLVFLMCSVLIKFYQKSSDLFLLCTERKSEIHSKKGIGMINGLKLLSCETIERMESTLPEKKDRTHSLPTKCLESYQGQRK